MSGSNKNGPLLTAGNLRAAIRAKADAWLSFHMAEAERAEGVAAGSIARPNAYETPTDVAKWPESALPCMLVVVAAEVNPRAMGDGVVRYDVPVDIGVVVGGVDEADVRRQQSVYGAALRQFASQRLSDLPPLDVEGVSLPLGSYDDIPQQQARSRAMASFAVVVTLNDMVARYSPLVDAPGDPLEDPGPYPEGVPPAVITINRVDEVSE